MSFSMRATVTAFLFFYIITVFIGYEIHFYELSPLPEALAIVFLTILVFIDNKSGSIRLNPPMLVAISFFSWCFFSLFIRLLLGSYESYFDLIKLFLVFLIFLIYSFCSLSNIKSIFKGIYLLTFIASLFNVVLFMFDGNFLWWSAIYGTRYASFFYLHNFAGALFGFQLIYAIYNSDMRAISRLFGASLALFSLLISFSKGSFVAVFGTVALCILFYSRLSVKFLLILILMVSIFLFYKYLEELESLFPIFRLFSGLNERDEMWFAALSSMENLSTVVFGGGEYFLHKMIENLGKDYLSTHNYFIDTVVSSGFPALFLLISLCLLVLYELRYRSNTKLFFAIAIYLIISANKSRFSLGGVTLLSAMLSLSFAYAIQSWGRSRDTVLR